jgi:hypothetical protein
MDHRARFQMVQYWETYVKREFVLTDEDNDGSDDREGQAEGGEFWVPVMGVPDDDDRGVKGGFLKVARYVDGFIARLISGLNHRTIGRMSETYSSPLCHRS